MSDWKKRSQILQDVVFFEYVDSSLAREAPHVFVWDLDKTYLDTHFESISGLYRTIKEKAFQKRNVPGTRTLVKALTVRGDSFFPIYFVTASPPQMEKRIREKLELDGIKPFGIFCKDNLKNLKPGRFRRLNQQVGYKLQALMHLRARLGQDLKQVLWGDDSESDAVIYSLYSDICARRLVDRPLAHILSFFNVRGEQVDTILELLKQVPEADPVERAYINLASDTDPDYYSKFGRRTLATYNAFQAALDLYQEKHLSLEQVEFVALDLKQNYGFTLEELAKSLDDLVYRRVLVLEEALKIKDFFVNKKLLPNNFSYSRQAISQEEASRLRVEKGSRLIDAWVPNFIDYLHDFR
ncbi:MAG: hypothetical protein KDD37_02365 [Bdellovibrionales bacterium]|nr:hypothetical protein [Bdellovibrionales bacterium]